MLYINILYFFLFSTFIFSYETIDSNHLRDTYYNSIYLNLESHKRTIYLLDYYNPNITEDITYLGFHFDGSMSFPLYVNIPYKGYVESNDTLTMSQISAFQDHGTNFYDASCLIKQNISENLDILMQFESKSFKKENYNHKALFSINKKTENSFFDIGYIYNYTDIKSEFLDADDNIAFFNRRVENFHIKFNYLFENDNFSIHNNVNTQFSNYNRFEYNYQTNTNWNILEINYLLNNNYVFTISSDYKYTVSDNDSPQPFLNNNYHKISPSFNVNIENISFVYGIDYFKNENFYFYTYNINMKRFNFGIERSNKCILSLSYDENDKYKMNKNLHHYENFSFSYNNSFITNKFSIGFVENINESYKLYINSTNLEYNWLKLNIDFAYYDSDNLFLTSFRRAEIIVSPNIKNVRYKIYFKVLSNHLSINSNYKINHKNLSFFIPVSNESPLSLGLSHLDGEFGILFRYFKISFKL